MPKRADVKRVLVIGSGPIVIGQAAEFDYAGTQACRSLREEGVSVVLVNSNPATIMTDREMADRVYLEPLTPESVARILERERPDGLLPTLGGQTGLNLAFDLAKAGVLDRLGVRLLGTPLEAIERAEDRERFKLTMEQIGEPVPQSGIVTSVKQALAFADSIGYPVIVRPAYTLGGTGGGIAENPAQLAEIASRGLKRSLIGQVLIEKSVAGWKEIEFEVMRDAADNCITVCSMENIDPIGIHTGDSIVVAPTQTLTDPEYQRLRSAALKIIRALGIEGGCNIQFAVSPTSFDYYVIEVNPRVSRSSALASKATGYPIARVAAKIAVGLHLDEIANAVTGKTLASFEPVIDYVVVKIPRWPFDKFALADRQLGTQMKATGEVMAIDRTLEAALQKAIRSLEIGLVGLASDPVAAMSDGELRRRLKAATDERLVVLAEALRRGMPPAEAAAITAIDPFFIGKIARIVEMEREAPAVAGQALAATAAASGLEALKRAGFSDARLARLAGWPVEAVRSARRAAGIRPVYKMVDTCAGEFDAQTAYLYSTYEQEEEVGPAAPPSVVVLGSGPIRIGQGIEFDYCSVHAVWALQRAGYRAIIVNNNPETVSTDFDTSDRLYFEPLTVEDVLHVCEKEQPLGVVVQFGGQTAINLAAPLAAAGVPVLGTPVEAIDLAEDREKFGAFLNRLGIPQPEGRAAVSVEEAMGIALKIGFPLLVRPSYVLGGRAMAIVRSEEDLFEYVKTAAAVSENHPVLIDRYVPGREVEVDAVCDGETVVIPGIMEHVERAGIHSGDSTAVFPPRHLPEPVQRTIVAYTEAIARGLGVKGLLNIQFVVHEGRVYVLEVNPRASRTVPFLSKVTGIPLVGLATQAMLGTKLADLGYRSGLLPPPPFVAVKAPVFSFEKLGEVEVSLGPEMKSTGEVMGIDFDYGRALYKALSAAGFNLPAAPRAVASEARDFGDRQGQPAVQPAGRVLISLADTDKQEGLRLASRLAALGYQLLATAGTAEALEAAGIPVAQQVLRIGEGHPDALDLIREGKVDLVINTPTRGRIPERNGFRIRRAAVEYKVPCLTSLDLAEAMVEVMGALQTGEGMEARALDEYLAALARAEAGAGEETGDRTGAVAGEGPGAPAGNGRAQAALVEAEVD